MSGITSVSGLITGIKTDQVISQILTVARRPITQLRSRQGLLQLKIGVYQELNARLASVKSELLGLQDPSSFRPRSGASSDTDILDVTVSNGAALGSQTITVEEVARNHQIKSQVFADFDSTTVGIGDLTIEVGNASTVITVDAANNTLQGLRDAINASDADVIASIVQESDSAYRLMIASKDTGTSNTLTITDTLSGGTAPTFTDLQAATDAQVKLGTGADAITITRETNSINDLLPNVTLTLKSADAANPVRVIISPNNTKLQLNVERFVSAYNDALDFVQQVSAFNVDENQNGVLVGDFVLQNIENDIAEIVTGFVDGLQGQLSTFAEVGITMDSDGKLELDTTLFNQKLVNDPDGVAGVFARTTTSTNQAVRYISSGSKTLASATGYAVEITQAATKTRLTAGVDITTTLAAGETLTINGIDIALSLGDDLTAVLAAINARSDDTGVSASDTDINGGGSGNYLTLTSTRWGSAQKITVLSGLSNAGSQSSGFGNVTVTEADATGESGSGTADAGLDVAGTINDEAATGVGQFLTGVVENQNTGGLQLQITATAPGSFGSIQIFDGLAKRLDTSLRGITDIVDGVIQTEISSLQTGVDDLQDAIDDREEALARQEIRLRKQFTRMEIAIGQLQTQQSALGSLLNTIGFSS